MEVSTRPEARHRRDHPQDLIAQLQVEELAPKESIPLEEPTLVYW